jgi:pilus assembly protein Flp/PilA
MVDRLNILVLDLFSRLQLKREEGQGMVEYALILAVVAVVAVGAWRLVGGSVSAKGSSINTQLTCTTATCP